MEVSWAGRSHNRQLPCPIWRLIDWLSCGFDLILPDLHQKITSHHVLQAPDVTFKPLWKALCTFYPLPHTHTHTHTHTHSLSLSFCLMVNWLTKKWKKGGDKVVSLWDITHTHIQTDAHTLPAENITLPMCTFPPLHLEHTHTHRHTHTDTHSG